MAELQYRTSCTVADDELNALHDRAFGGRSERQWGRQLAEHSLGWLCAYDAERLIGFANVAWDGGCHAFLLDVCVDPAKQRSGVGRELVQRAAHLAGEQGCEWLHVDFMPELTGFYIEKCGFNVTAAGLLALTDQ